MPDPHDPVFDALPHPAARVGPAGELRALNPAWRDQRPWGIVDPGARLVDTVPQLAPRQAALARSGGPPPQRGEPGEPGSLADPTDPVEATEAQPVDTATPPRRWRLRLTALPRGEALLLAQDITEPHAAARRLEAVVEHQPQLICRFRADTTVLFANQAYCDYYRTTAAELVGRKIVDLVPRGRGPVLLEHLAKLTPDRPTAKNNHPVKQADGTDGWQSWTDRAFFDHRGQVVEYQAVGHDISDQKQIEAELRARRQETQLILDSIPALVWFKDRQGHILRLNQQAAELIGRPPAEVEGRHTREFFPEHAAQYQIDDDAVFASGTSRIGIIEPIVDGRGQTRWYRTDKVPLRVEGKSFDRLLALSIDVTDLVRAEERIRDSESRFRGLFERVPAAVFEYDLSGPATLVQELKARTVADPRAHLIRHPETVREANRRTLIRGMNQALLDLFEATSHAQINEVFRRGGLGDELEIGRQTLTALWNGTSSVKFETNGFTRTGRPLDLLFRMDVPRDAENQLDPSRALISLTDLTERTRRIFDEARVEQAAEERRDLGHELHDGLGQRLTGLNMLCATLHRRMAARSLPEAHDVAELGDLIKNANLEVRRLISGLTPEPITAADLTTALNGLGQNVERTHEITVTLRSEPAPAQLTDEQANHLLMIAGEAAHNAAKHGRPRQIRLSLLREGSDLVLEIADDGLGLAATAADKKPRQFNDPRQFSRDHPDYKPSPVPTGGRGMHIMRYRARQIGATIQVMPSPGGGTTVRCTLPLEDAGPRPVSPTPPPACPE